jgi:putative ABC transport system permease protein
MGAMTFGLVAMILYAGLVEGYLRGLERNVLDLEMGDIQIHEPTYRKKPSLYKKIERDRELLATLADAGYPASARLLGPALAAAGDVSAGVSLRGLDPDRDARVSAIYEHVADGRWLAPNDPQGVVLGRKLARILDISVGDSLLLLGQGADGSMANDEYQVRGILKGVADGVDRSGVYMTEVAFRELMVVPTGAHQIIVRRPPSVALAQALTVVEGVAGDGEAKTWKQLVPTMASMLESTRGAMLAMYVIIYIGIGMLILNTMLMAVLERVREFGVLKAIGVGPLRLFGLVMAESTLMTGVATAVGAVLSIPGLLYLERTGIDLSAVTQDVSIAGIAWDPIWTAEVNTDTFATPISTMVFIVLLAVIYPAMRAALIRPVMAMRQE